VGHGKLGKVMKSHRILKAQKRTNSVDKAGFAFLQEDYASI